MDLADRDIVQLYRNGLTRTELAELAGCSRDRIDRILTRAGENLVPSWLHGAVRDAVIERYRAGASLSTLAATLPISRARITHILAAEGLLRRRGRPAGGLLVNPGVNILDVYRRGGWRAVARTASVSRATAYRLVASARRDVAA